MDEKKALGKKVLIRSFDYSRLVNKAWDTDIVDLAAKIHECKGRQDLFIRQKYIFLNRPLSSRPLKQIKILIHYLFLKLVVITTGILFSVCYTANKEKGRCHRNDNRSLDMSA